MAIIESPRLEGALLHYSATALAVRTYQLLGLAELARAGCREFFKSLRRGTDILRSIMIPNPDFELQVLRMSIWKVPPCPWAGSWADLYRCVLQKLAFRKGEPGDLRTPPNSNIIPISAALTVLSSYLSDH